jgi:hypothetical protein
MFVARTLRCLFILAAGLPAAAQITQSQAFDLPGKAPVFSPEAEPPRVNFSTMGLRISSSFDDNALNARQNQQADLVAFVQPNLGWRVSGARVDWTIDYTLGLSRSEHCAAYDSLSHLLDGGLQLRLTKRLKLLVHEAFLKSANPFDQLQAIESATGPSVHAAPTDTAAVTATDLQTEQASGDIAYSLNAHSTVGFGGEFFSARYSLPSGGVSSGQLLQSSSSTVGHGYYMRQVTRHQRTGLDYRVQKSIFNSGQSSSLVHSLAYTHTVAISPATALSFFVGPERSVTQGVAGIVASSSLVSSAPQSAWQWSGGATAQWSGRRTIVRAKLSRSINDGGLLGSAQLSTSSAEISRQIGRQWITRVMASYDHARALVGTGTLSYPSGAASLTYMLRPNLSFELQYWRVHMSGSGSLPADLLADHNRVSMSFVYEHRHPLGK